MKKIKNCKHCYELFESRRSNHVYCTTSCKTKASYKRNEYKYISGHYKKEEIALAIPENELPVSNELLDAFKALETKIENMSAKPEINSGSISNAAIGSAAADATVYVGKKLFAPQLLPATKGDVDTLKQEIQNLKFLINMKRS
ncbi:hypothetical protein ACW5R3_03860 [Bizionia sp. KMM 8389]